MNHAVGGGQLVMDCIVPRRHLQPEHGALKDRNSLLILFLENDNFVKEETM